MKKKIIALTIATAIFAATFSVAGCSKDKAPSAMSEDEWKAAWQATYEITNFTMKGEQNTVVVPSIEVSKTDFENNNYQVPEVGNLNRLIIKEDTSLRQQYMENVGHQVMDVNTWDIQYGKFCRYFFVNENTPYLAECYNDDYDNWSLDIESEEYLGSYTLSRTLSDLGSLLGISFIDSYSSFTFNSQTNTYEGTFTINGSDENFSATAKFKFSNGKLSEFAVDSVIYNEIDSETLSVSHSACTYTISDIGNTVPITDEEMQMLKGLITE